MQRVSTVPLLSYDVTHPEARQRAFLGLERPSGALPWENKEPRPLKDRGSNEMLLVAPTRIELVTSGL